MQDVKLALGARDGHVGESALLLDLGVAPRDGLHAREKPLLHAGEKHDGKLQPLCAVHRHQNNGVCRLVVAIHVGHERRFLQKAREGGVFVFFHIFKNARLELLQVLQTLGLLGPCVHPHLPIARKIEHTVKEDVQAHGLSILGQAVDQIGKAFQRCAAAVKCGVA